MQKKRDYVADHARRTLRRAGLTTEQARQFVRNCKRQALNARVYSATGFMWRCDLSEYSRKLPYTSVSRTIDSAFLWEGSQEGWQYWCDLSDEFARKEKNAQA